MYPSLEEVKKIAASGEYRRIPVCRELYADRYTPVEVLRTLRGSSRHCYLLESASQTESWGRYSFLGCHPTLELNLTDGELTIRRTAEARIGAKTQEAEAGKTDATDASETVEVRKVTHPGEALREILKDYKSPVLEGLPPFTGGLVGYFSSDDIEIAGASPETLVKLEDGHLSTFPLAGTRPRGRTKEEDRELEEGLLKDEKELAEHNMLVDLGRNDIGKISKIGTVQVEKYMTVERFSHVMHLGSTVTGIIRDDKDAVDAVDAILPAGTLSGAPKFRACQIIEELEQSKRGIYGGAIGYLDFAGNLDTCIAIRLVYKKNGEICIRSGAGIVADSVPEKEFEECCNKARAVVQAIEKAQEGLE